MNQQPKTAGIYNRWLFTLGGGEQVTFAYAEALRDAGYHTTLLTHKKVDIVHAEKKMNVKLNGITIKYIPLVSAEALSEYSEKFDLFINTSYLDYFPNRSRSGFLSVFFPAEIYLSPREYLKRKIFIPSLKLLFIYPTEFDGFLHDTYSEGRINKWLGTHSNITFNNQGIHSLATDLYFPIFSYSSAESVEFLINDQKTTAISKTLNHKTNVLTYEFSSKVAIKKFTIVTQSKYKVDIALSKLTIPKLRYYFYNVFKNFFPKWEMRLHGGPGVTSLSDIQSYKNIITISKFCQYWIRKYWNLPSKILYPPVNTAAFRSAEKKNWICHIGRFFVTGHSKKQLELIRVFKELVDNKQLVGWELHLIGSVHEGRNHGQYFEMCLEEALGYPVIFHTKASFVEVKQILSKSNIYWHATGLDQDPKNEPILFEHFGITTVEAMASGCIPIVINAGGQPEIVTKESGFVWNSREELKKFTIKISQSKKLQKKYSLAAKKRSEYFSKENFLLRFKKIANL